MQERAVTAAGQVTLPGPFFVLATQNPIEQEGTYPLPEAQLDRFMFNTWVDYPSFDEEVNVVKQTTSDASSKCRPSSAETFRLTSKSFAACLWPTTWSTTRSTSPLPIVQP